MEMGVAAVVAEQEYRVRAHALCVVQRYAEVAVEEVAAAAVA